MGICGFNGAALRFPVDIWNWSFHRGYHPPDRFIDVDIGFLWLGDNKTQLVTECISLLDVAHVHHLETEGGFSIVYDYEFCPTCQERIRCCRTKPHNVHQSESWRQIYHLLDSFPVPLLTLLFEYAGLCQTKVEARIDRYFLQTRAQAETLIQVIQKQLDQARTEYSNTYAIC